MKIISSKSIYLLLFAFYLSCNLSVNKSFNDEQVAKEVQQMLMEYHKAIAEDGLTAEFQFLDNSSDFYWVPPGYKSALDYDSVYTILNQNALMFDKVIFKWDTLQVFPLSNEIANYSGIVMGVMTDTSGAKTKMSIIESGTLIKRESGWKLLSGQSALLPENN